LDALAPFELRMGCPWPDRCLWGDLEHGHLYENGQETGVDIMSVRGPVETD